MDPKEALSADSTDHLRTVKGSERVVGTERIEEGEDDWKPSTERFRKGTTVEPVSIGNLPTED